MTSRAVAFGVFVVVVGAYLWLALLFVRSIPAWEAPDETGHFAYVRHLVEERSFPTRTTDGANQFHQPPLAYLLGAAVVADLDLTDFDRVKPNPNFIWSRRGAEPNAMLHTRDEYPATLPIYQALERLRLLSVMFGVGVVIVTRFVTRAIFPDRPWLAVIAAALVASLPQFVFATSVLNNDAIASFFGALAIWSLARIVMGRDDSVGEHLRLGAYLGLGVLAKTNMFAIVAVAVVVLGARWVGSRMSPAALGRGLAAAVGLAVVGGWWYARNYIVYRGVLANQTYVDDKTLPQIAAFGYGVDAMAIYFAKPLFQSFVAMYGWMTLPVDPAVYNACLIGLVVATGGVVWWFATRRGDAAQRRAVAMLILLTLGLIGLIWLRWLTTIGNHYPQGRYLFLALPAVAVLVALGLETVFTRRAAPLVGVVGAVLLFTIGHNHLSAYAAPSFQPLNLWLSTPNHVQHPVGYVLAAQLHLVGYDVKPEVVQRGENVELALYWQAMDRIPTDYHVFVHLGWPDTPPVAQDDVVPAAPAYPPSRWLPGDVIRQTHTLAVPVDLAPGAYRLLVGAYRYPELTRLRATAPTDGRDTLDIGAISVR